MPVKLVFIPLTLNGSQGNYSSIYKEFCGSHEEITLECKIYYSIFSKPNYFSKSLKVILLQDYSMGGKSPQRKVNFKSNFKIHNVYAFPRSHSKTCEIREHSLKHRKKNDWYRQ